MPFRNFSKTGEITREHLQPDMRQVRLIEETYSGDGELPEPAEATGIEVLLGGDVLAGDAVGIDGNGKGVKASLAFPAVGIAIASGTTGDYVYIITSGYFESSRYFLTVGKLAWLSSGSGTAVNISPGKPTIAVNNHVQTLGTAISVNRLQIAIGEATIIK